MNKKKLAIIILMLMLLTSCVLNKEKTNKKSDNRDLIAQTKEYSLELSDGSYKQNDFYNNFNKEAQENLSKNKLYQFIDHFNSITGEVKDIEKVQVTEQSILLMLDNEKRKSSEIYSYDNEGKLTNLSMFPGSVKPKKTKTYTVDPVELSMDNLVIPGALTMPVNAENPPIVIMVTGLGPHDMDETIGLSGNQPFKDIALGLARNGIASLRYDKSILHGNNRNSIDDEYFNDFNAAYEYVKTLDNVNKDNIYILAHGTGASLAPTMAKDKDIKGIVLMAGSLRHLADTTFDQNELLVKQSNGLSEEDKNKQLDEMQKKVYLAKNIKEDSKEEPFGLKASYWNSLNKLDLKKDILDYPGRLFIIQGANDFQNIPSRNYFEYFELLSGRYNVSFKLFENTSHIFTESTTNNYDMSVYDKKSRVKPDVIYEISKWINN